MKYLQRDFSPNRLYIPLRYPPASYTRILAPDTQPSPNSASKVVFSNEISMHSGLMERRVQEDMTLIDPSNQQPIHLKCGECVMISPEIMRDPAVYADPETYDGFRFYKLRFGPLPQDKAASEEDQPGGGAPPTLGRKNIWQLTSLSPDHLGFGVGIHACPGRFFVAN